MNYFNNKSIMITGGTGSFGSSLLKNLLKNNKPKKIIIYSRDEHKQLNLKNQIAPSDLSKVRFFMGDIRDKERLNLATRNVEVIIHAAALKVVPAAEYNPFEFIKTNVIGAQNVIETSFYNNVKKVIALSTDKACSPINLYGTTKLASDKLFISANNYKGDFKTVFSVVRYGNVMGSNGSVIPLFNSQKKTGQLSITDKNMTRFNITLKESTDFVKKVTHMMMGGEIFVPKLSSYKIKDLAKAISSNSKLKYIGIRPGEKLHEEMISNHDSLNCVEYSNFFVIRPHSEYYKWDLNLFNKKNKIKNKKNNLIKLPYQSNSTGQFLSEAEIKKILLKENLI